MNTKVSIGRIVRYTLNEQNAEDITRRREGDKREAKIHMCVWPADAQTHIGNPVKAGDTFPMLIVRDWGGNVSGQVFLDGNDVLWVTSVVEGTEPGTWAWPPRESYVTPTA
jgi:hypothetical protein